MEKFQNFAMKRFMLTMIHIFLEISKAEVTKPVSGIHDENIIEKS